MLVTVGYFVFVGFVACAVILGLIAQDYYRRGLTNINPLGWPAVGFVMLLIRSPWARSLLGR